MTRAIEAITAVAALVIGVSHAVRPRAWAELFVRLRAWGHAGALVNGAASLAFGAPVVIVHEVWHGPAVVLTLLGWAQLTKGVLNLVAPRLGLRSLARVSPERPGGFVAGGVLLVAVGCACGWAALAP